MNPHLRALSTAQPGVNHLIPQNIRTDPAMQYLIYKKPSHAQRTGFSHMKSNLGALLREAAWLGRVPVIPATCAECLRTSHNLHYPVKSSWEDYWDLKNIQVAFNLKSGVQRLTLPVITETEFNALDISAADILKPDNDHVVTPEENSRYQAIVRYLPKNFLWRKQVPQQFNPDSFAHGTATPADAEVPLETVKTTFTPSHAVREMADNVIKKLPDDYHAMHIRRGDGLRIPGFIEVTDPRFILQKLDEFGIKPGATLFVMTNEHRKRYLDPLKKKYRIVRYTDFPELKSLVTRPEPIDNHLLFAVESEILKHAKKKIYTFKATGNEKQDETFFLMNAVRPDMKELNSTLEFQLKSKIEIHRMRMRELLRYPRLNFISAEGKKHLIKSLCEEFHLLCSLTTRLAWLRMFSPGSLRRKIPPDSAKHSR